MKLANSPFDEGAMRAAHFAQFSKSLHSIPFIQEHVTRGNGLFVAKMYKEQEDQQLELHKADCKEQVLMFWSCTVSDLFQDKIREWAEKYNAAVAKVGQGKVIKVLDTAVCEFNVQLTLFITIHSP